MNKLRIRKNDTVICKKRKRQRKDRKSIEGHP